MKASRDWVDPFDEMTDDEFDAEVVRLFSAGSGSVAVSLRVDPDLLGRVKRQATRAGVSYQTFMKSILEAAVSRLERRPELKAPVRKASHRQ
jgi:predicted DNA binding CopG/RHH family protein